MIQIQEPVEKIQQKPKKYETFEFKPSFDKQPEASTTLFVAFYGPSAIYLQSSVKPQWKIGTLNFMRAKQQALAEVYSNSGSLYLIFKQDFSNCIQYFLGDFVFDNFKFQKLVVIDWRSEALQDNKGQQLKYLKTSTWKDKTLGSLFEGFINGTTAGLLQEGQIRGLPVLHFIAVIGDYELTRKQIDLYNILESFELKTVNEQALSKLIKKYNQTKGNGRLYM